MPHAVHEHVRIFRFQRPAAPFVDLVVHAPELVAQGLRRHRGRLDAELRAIGRARLLVIDELGYLPIDIDGARLLFQVVADSYEKRSVVFTTNLEFGRWGEVFGDGDMAAAVIDRIVHHGRIVRFRGESYRNSHSLMK